jgi:hypothetical protein
MNEEHSNRAEALQFLRQSGGLVRTGAAIAAGINPATLYALRDEGLVERVTRGLYCLLSALEWHDLTTQIPHAVHLAIRQGAWRPKLDYPPLRVFRLTEPCFSAGIEVHEIGGVPVRIYSAEKTLVDCFKYRNKIGLDVALEALKLYRQRGKMNVSELMRHGVTCRMSRIMRPYLDALLI